MKKQRLDLKLIELGLFESREVARTAIMDGGILVDGEKVTKPGAAVAEKSTITIAPGWGTPKYVSRGGLKLEKALSEFAIDPSGRVCLDVGASTGGFTDCLLKQGARLVYAIDVGYGQLDWSLRKDSRVIVKERVNARLLTPEALYENNSPVADFAVIDVSFISLAKILPACVSLLHKDKKELACLIKPQFEAGREAVGKGGVVRSPQVHEQVINAVIQEASRHGLATLALTYSPVKGPAGNIEYLIHLKAGENAGEFSVSEVVSGAFATLSG